MPAARRNYGGTPTMFALAAIIVGVLATGTTTAIMRSGIGAPGQDVAGAPAPGPGGLMGTAGSSDVELSNEPVAVRIPAIEVDANMIRLGLNDDNTLEVPPFELAGWYRGGPKPGETGPAVIAAHVDSTDGPAVFFRLDELGLGETIAVDYADGTSVDFQVTAAKSFPKSEFPTERVYGDTDQSVLRLITCGGSFDEEAKSYRENLVVFARATSSDSADQEKSST